MPSDPTAPRVVKVTTKDPKHSYFVYFDRETSKLLDVREYKIIYTPGTRPLTNRLRDIIVSASIILLTPEAQETEK